MKTIRLMLVDDHDVVRTGIRSFLEAQGGFQIVAEARSGREVLQRLAETKPEVVVMDITIPDMDGLEATRRIRSAYPHCQVLALTIHHEKEYFFEMLAAGATGYLTKEAAAEELVAAIRCVAEGNVYLQPTLARWLLEDYRRLLSQATSEARPTVTASVQTEGLSVLSRRERQVLEAVAQGLTNSQIGELLGISPKTVARHRERIMNKLQLHSSTELVKFAIRTGLIRVD